MGTTSDATPGGSTSKASGHRPVLLHPVIESLQPRPGAVIVDGTLGGGGITAALLERVMPGGYVLAIDRDLTAIHQARERFHTYGDALRLIHGNFADVEKIVEKQEFSTIDGITLDLGISSIQLDDPVRGFSFRFDGPLDMRMDQSAGTTTAAEIVNSYTEEQLVEVIRTYGEERFARSIVKAIINERGDRPLHTTTDLRTLVERVIPRKLWPKRIHPATKTFQALRIEVNDELRNLGHGLQAAIRVLRPGGRLGVIAFHSLEDTLTKHTLHVSALNCLCPPQQPFCTCAHRASLFLPSRKAIKADADEIAVNPRARSARLRVAEKI